MTYKPRRVADFVDESAVEATPASVASAPRRGANRLADRLFRQFGTLAAGTTIVATAVAVVISASTGTAAAVGVPTPAVSASAAEPLIAEELTLLKPASLVKKQVEPAVAVSRQFTEASLNVRAEPDSHADRLGRLSAATRVEATSQVVGDYRKIVFGDGFGWVLADSLDDSDAAAVPKGTSAAVPKGTSMEPCARGSRVENKLRKTTIFIYRSVCPLFPQLNSVGGWRAGGRSFHKNGRALDLMLTPGKESALGHRIAAYLIAHRAEFKIDHIIFEQKIWTRSNPHWRKMANRGSINANHFNHVHVAVVSSAR